MGITLKRDGSGFEGLIESGFQGYFDAQIAWLNLMPVPTAPCGMRTKHGLPLFVRKGKAPFDVYGWMTKDGKAVGAELKQSGERKPSLAIVPPGGDGAGLEFHQLDALAQLARNGGTAKVVWDNGGAYGVLDESQIIVAHQTYLTTLTARSSPPGSKSIKWELFRTVDFASVGNALVLDWLR